MSALEHSGPEGDLQRDPELIDDRPSSLDYRNVHDKLQPQHPGNDAFDEISSTVNGREQPILTAAACVIGTIGNIARHPEPLTPQRLLIITRAAQCHEDELGAHGLTIEQSAISPDAQNTINGFLTLQAETHPSLKAREAISAVRDRYFPTVA
jgi:hypothetical protein